MKMRGEPRNISSFDKTWRNLASEFQHSAKSWRRARHGTGRARSRFDLFLTGVPRAVVPLANVARPFLDGQLGLLIADAECFSLIAIGCGRQEIEAIESPCGKFDGLAVRAHSVCFAGTSRSQAEAYAGIVDRSRQHLGRQGLALRRGRIAQQAIETAFTRLALVSSDGDIVVQLDGCRSHCRLLRHTSSDLYRKRPWLVGIEAGYKIAIVIQ